MAISIGNRRDNLVHFTENPDLLAAMLSSQQQRRKRGTQGKSVEGGDRNRKRDGQRKLAEKNSSGSRKERNRHEYCDQNQGSRDHRAGHFLHGGRGRLDRIGLTFLDVAFDILD